MHSLSNKQLLARSRLFSETIEHVISNMDVFLSFIFILIFASRKADELSASEVRYAELDADVERASDLVQQYEARDEVVQKKYEELETDFQASESDLATAREEIESMEQKSKESEISFKVELSDCQKESAAFRKTFEAESAAAQQISLKFEEGMTVIPPFFVSVTPCILPISRLFISRYVAFK